MKTILLSACAILFFSTTSLAEEVFRIEVSKGYQNYSNEDLKRRVWELERAVWQLQQRVFQLESGPSRSAPDTWICKISAMGDVYTGTGGSKAVAKHKATEACKNARKGDGFFCKDPVCEQ